MVTANGTYINCAVVSGIDISIVQAKIELLAGAHGNYMTWMDFAKPLYRFDMTSSLILKTFLGLQESEEIRVLYEKAVQVKISGKCIFLFCALHIISIE